MSWRGWASISAIAAVIGVYLAFAEGVGWYPFSNKNLGSTVIPQILPPIPAPTSSVTLAPAETPTPTPDLQATVAAIVEVTMTALPPPTHTPTPIPTVPTEMPGPTAAPTPVPNPTPTNPGTYGTYSLTTSSGIVPQAGNITVNWTAPADHSGKDWIGLYKQGDPNRTYQIYEYVPQATSGSLIFTIPPTATAGQYEFRYLLNDGYVDMARSSIITVSD